MGGASDGPTFPGYRATVRPRRDVLRTGKPAIVSADLARDGDRPGGLDLIRRPSPLPADRTNPSRAADAGRGRHGTGNDGEGCRQSMRDVRRSAGPVAALLVEDWDGDRKRGRISGRGGAADQGGTADAGAVVDGCLENRSSTVAARKR